MSNCCVRLCRTKSTALSVCCTSLGSHRVTVNVRWPSHENRPLMWTYKDYVHIRFRWHQTIYLRFDERNHIHGNINSTLVAVRGVNTSRVVPNWAYSIDESRRLILHGYFDVAVDCYEFFYRLFCLLWEHVVCCFYWFN